MPRTCKNMFSVSDCKDRSLSKECSAYVINMDCAGNGLTLPGDKKQQHSE